MAKTKDAAEPIRKRAAEFPDVAQGTSCNQSSFKTGSGTFLFIGPGAKGHGFKAMFKLGPSMPRARELASNEPNRFEVGKTGWVTVRFSDEKPLQKYIWEKWLKESYNLCLDKQQGLQGTGKKTARKKAAKRKA